MKATTVGTAGGGAFVQVEGLASLMRHFKNVDPRLKRAFQKALKESVSPVLEKARANASSISLNGTYAGSLSIASRKGGSMYVLKSTDPAAGVKEFARQGATYRPKPTDKRRNARSMASFPVGVPRRANAPRAMIPAVDDSTEEIVERIDAALADVMDQAGG